MRNKRVLAFGSFDLLHPGHVFYLERAKKLGSELTVVIARDSSIMREKKHAPMQDETTRLEIVRALKPVDKAIFGFRHGERLRIIERVKPDIIALGYDQEITKKEIQRYLRETRIKARVVRIPAFKRRKYRSTLIKKKISLGIENLFE